MAESLMSDPIILSLLKDLSLKVCKPYAQMPQTKAILSIGSVSYGIVDESSDIDMALYYDELPSDQELHDAMVSNGAAQLNWRIGNREDGGLIDSYMVYGVECQFAHTTLTAMKRDMDSILVGFEVASPFQKALSGVLAGAPIVGEALINEYKARAATYPAGLRKAMVEHFMNFQPLWAIEDRMSVRDAELWRMQALVDGSYNLLGVLAGLNRLYYSSFQFKRMGAFIDQMEVKPNDLCRRITLVFKGKPTAATVFRELVAETVELVEKVMPEVNTSVVHSRLNRSVHRWNAEVLATALARD